MKVLSRTLLTSATMAAGVMTLPALGTAAADVHLVTSVEIVSHAPDGVRYVVTVRPVGGPAHVTTLVLSTRRPAAWRAGAAGCLPSADRTALACDLGDVRESEPRTLHVIAEPGGQSPTGVPVTVQARAANAPSVTSSLGAARPAAARLGGKAADEPPAASPEPSARPSEEPSASESASAPASAEPSGEPSAGPAESEVVQSPDGRSAAAVRPPGRSPTPSARPRAPHPAAAARPSRPPVPGHPAAVPPAPVIPHMPVVPAPPAEVPAVPPPNGPLGGPALPLPAASPALPQLAPHASPGSGISQLEPLSPAGAMQAGRTSWATLIAVAVVAEAGLLWVITGFTVWRRKRVPRSGPRLRGRSRRLTFSRQLP